MRSKPRKRRLEWDDYDQDFPLVMNHIEVFDEEEVLAEKSAILDQHGNAIVIQYASAKQGFMGFIDFTPEDEDDYEEDE